MVPFSITLTDP